MDNELSEEKKLDREKAIKKEYARLKRIFKDLDGNKKGTVDKLIRNAAFMAISLEELQGDIIKGGFVSEYKNGENQFGTKKSPEVEIYIQMSKNYSTVIKQLVEIVPMEKRKNSKLQALRDE